MDGDFFAGGHWGIGLMGRKRCREVCWIVHFKGSTNFIFGVFNLYHMVGVDRKYWGLGVGIPWRKERK